MAYEEFVIHQNIIKKINDLHSNIEFGSACDSLVELEDLNIISPVEQLFYVYWEIVRRGRGEWMNLHSQTKILNYRVDFSVGFISEFVNSILIPFSSDELSKIDKFFPKVCIEIDGHWHEKTKEQVSKDKKRERDLIKEGWSVLRYSGSEIYNNTSKHVVDAYEHCDALFHKGLKQFSKEFKYAI